jgi:hypothetical protein
MSNEVELNSIMSDAGMAIDETIIFIVGMPRSGTKLLRGLLNRSPELAILREETHFIPHMVSQFGDPSEIGDGDLRLLVDFLQNTAFYLNMLQKYGMQIDVSAFDHLSPPYTWNAIILAIFRAYAPAGKREVAYYGDKTPGYVRHMPLLKSLVPGAVFLHIMRDPRDYALSVRRSFGKSLRRAAARWAETVSEARATGASMSGTYFELRYEDLLSDPERTMRSVCEFLQVPFDTRMLALESPSENLGDARDTLEIVRSNKEKYLNMLSPGEIRRVEQIVMGAIEGLGYEPLYAARPRPLGRLERLSLKLFDGYASARMHVRDKGLVNGLQYFLLHYRKSSWR